MSEEKKEKKSRVEPFFIFIMIMMLGMPALSLLFLFNSNFQNYIINFLK
jgi:hypothetical protein